MAVRITWRLKPSADITLLIVMAFYPDGEMVARSVAVPEGFGVETNDDVLELIGSELGFSAIKAIIETEEYYFDV